MRLSRIIPSVLAATLAAGACTSDDPGSQATDLKGDDIILTSGLSTENSCDALLTRLIDEGLERVGPYGFGNQYGYLRGGPDILFAEGEAMEESVDLADGGASTKFSGADAAIEAAPAEGDDGSFSGTNNQEGGVDEADFVKTDGKRLVVANGTTIRVIDVSGDKPRLVQTIKLDESTWVQEMFLVGDRAVIMSQGWVQDGPVGPAGQKTNWIMPAGISTTSLTEINLESGSVGETITFAGSYLSGREVDGAIRIVVNASVGQFPFVYANGPAAEDVAEKTNRELLKESTIEQWLPSFKHSDGSNGSLIPCDQMHIPSEFSGFGTLAVLTLDMNDGLGLTDSLGVLTEGQTIYASTDRLAVATARWEGDFNWDDSEPPSDDYTTSLHTFDISNPTSTSYVASGSIAGHMLNQYSMSEHNGNLRVAVTEGAPWTSDSSQSSVIVLAEQGAELVTVGKVGGLGKGEQIQSVRFMGDTAYVVTFRQVDPLYTVDLSDPTSPKVLGELKIPGFSSYLHPIDDGLLMGIGQDGTDEGQLLGAQVSMFDVSDLSNPTRISALSFGDNSQSSVSWEAKAFTWWAPSRMAFVPVSSWGWDEQTGTDSSTADVVAVKIGEDGSLQEIGRLSQPVSRGCDNYYEDDYVEEKPVVEGDAEAGLSEPAGIVAPPTDDEPGYCWSYQPEIRRTVIIDDSIYTISEGGVMASSFSDFSQQAWIPFDQQG